MEPGEQQTREDIASTIAALEDAMEKGAPTQEEIARIRAFRDEYVARVGRIRDRLCKAVESVYKKYSMG